MNRRDFFRYGIKAGLGTVFSFGILKNSFGAVVVPQEVKVNIPSYTIELKDRGNLRGTYRCRVGAPWAQTPIGQGKIIKKRDRVVFRYLKGPNEGEVIEQTYLDPENRWSSMPYENMRGMDFSVNGRQTGAVFHSTTDYWTIGTPKSHGCIGLQIDEMLHFYDQVYYPLPDLDISYQTVFYNLHTEELTFWCDIYNRGTNNVTNVYGQMGFPGRHVDERTVRENLRKINARLESGHQYIQQMLARGKDPGSELHRLVYRISRNQLLYWRL